MFGINYVIVVSHRFIPNTKHPLNTFDGLRLQKAPLNSLEKLLISHSLFINHCRLWGCMIFKRKLHTMRCYYVVGAKSCIIILTVFSTCYDDALREKYKTSWTRHTIFIRSALDIEAWKLISSWKYVAGGDNWLKKKRCSLESWASLTIKKQINQCFNASQISVLVLVLEFGPILGFQLLKSLWLSWTYISMRQMFSIGERSGLQAGQFSTRTLLLWSLAVVIAAIYGFAFSCWNTHRLEGSICCSETFIYLSAWHNQIVACINAANVSAVWKHLKLSEKDTKLITSTKHWLRDCLSLHLMSLMRRARVDYAGYCMMIEIAKWPQSISK